MKRRFYVPVSQSSELMSRWNFEMRTQGDPNALRAAYVGALDYVQSLVATTDEKTEAALVEKSIELAIRMAQRVDVRVQSAEELDEKK